MDSNMLLFNILQLTITCSLTLGLTSAKDPLEYFLLEELPPETLIGNIVVDAGLESESNDTSVQFSILNQPKSHDDLFDIDSATGVIRTTAKIDRDTLCPFEETCHVWLHIAVRSGFSFRIFKVMVNILDTNDHRPVFPKSTIDLQIPESAVPGMTIAIPPASDLDSANNDIQSYDITSETSYFDLEVTKNDLDGSTDLKLVLLKQLDREDQGSHSLTIIALDGGLPHKTGSIVVNIEVEDANDNHPIFTKATYEFIVLENAAPNKIGEVKAYDNDYGRNGQIIYKLSRASDLMYGNKFEVHNSTGEIFASSTLDYEEKSMYVLTIEASDLGASHKTGTCTVVFKVQDVNDNAPLINLNTLTDDDSATVLENSPLDTFVAHMSVADLDAGLNGKVECVLNHPSFRLDEIYSGQFKVVTAAEMDRESVDHYTVPIACIDQGSPPSVAAVNLTINVQDANDNVPRFETDTYHFSIKENNDLGAMIADVKATDVDQDKNGLIRYSLLNDDQSDASKLFNIHPLTGQISTNAIFDHEVIKEVKFKVIASDEGQPSLSFTATVVLSIIDVNDEPPRFQKESYDFGTFENQPPGTEVGSIIATDADDDDDTTYEVTFCEDIITENTFVVDSTTGRITTTASLDREVRQKYFMIITAKSEIFPPMSTTVNVTIHVADINDNSPLIVFPNEQNNTVEVSAYDAVGTKITKILVTDDDIGTNAKLWYFIEGGDDEKYFKIDPISGSVSIQNYLSDLARQTRHLSIKVEDSGHPVRRSSALLKVIIRGQTNGLKMTSELARSNSSTVIILCVVSILVILTLVAGVYIMWRKGIFTLTSRSKETNQGQTQNTGNKPAETQQMLSSLTMISFLKDNEINNEKNTLNTGQSKLNNQHRQLNNAAEQQRHLQNTPIHLYEDPRHSCSSGPAPMMSHIVHIDAPPEIQCQEFSGFMAPELPVESESGYDEISTAEREGVEQESTT